MAYYYVMIRDAGSKGHYAPTGDAYEDEHLANIQAQRYLDAGKDAKVDTKEQEAADEGVTVSTVQAVPAQPEPGPSVDDELAALRAENARLRADADELARLRADVAQPETTATATEGQ